MVSLLLFVSLQASAGGGSDFQIKLRRDSGTPTPEVVVVVTPTQLVGGAAMSVAVPGEVGGALELARDLTGMDSRESRRASSSTDALDWLDLADRGASGPLRREQEALSAGFSAGVQGKAQWVVHSPGSTFMTLGCDYRLELWDGQLATRDVLTPAATSKPTVGRLFDALTETLATTMDEGGQAYPPEWQLVRCADNVVVGGGRVRRRIVVEGLKVKGDLTGVLAADAVASQSVRSEYKALSEDVAAWRAAGTTAPMGASMAGITPTGEGDFASPVQSNGKRAKWERQLAVGQLGGKVAATALQGATAGAGRLGQTAADLGAGIVEGVVKNKMADNLPADHYFDSACELIVWMDAAYSHRPDYIDILSTAESVYPDLRKDYQPCLLDAARDREAAGLSPPDTETDTPQVPSPLPGEGQQEPSGLQESSPAD